MSSLRERQEQNVAVVRRVVAAFQRGDLDEIFGLAHPDFEVFLLPTSRTLAGTSASKGS
jgi:ketosteroid isomerase-like protein